MRYKREERTFLVNRWHKLENATLVKRAWRTKFKTKSAPKRKTILNLIEKFTKMSLVNDLPPKHKEISNKREIAKIRLLFTETPNLSLQKASNLVGVSTTLIRNILKHDLKLKPYKPNQYFQLLPEHYPKRAEFVQNVLGLPLGTHNCFILCDEAHFYLTESKNKKNCRFWLPEPPTDAIKMPLHDEKVTVWYAVSYGKVYGPCFFDGNVNHHGKFFLEASLCEAKLPKILFYSRRRSSRVYNPLPKNIEDLKRNITKEI